MNNKPKLHQNITITRKVSKTVKARNAKWWAEWGESRPETYLRVPSKIARFSKYDSRKHDWRRLTPKT